MALAADAPLPASTHVAVIGAGAMGAGIAQVAALHGHTVQLHDSRFGAADAAKQAMAGAFASLVGKGRLTQADADGALARILTVVTRPDACMAGLVIEAIVEDLAEKRELFASLENVVAPECIFASNTSSLSITSLAAGLRHPQRMVGMHFFNPAPVMPLVEVVRGLATAPEVAGRVFATAQAWGKTPVHATSTPGFIVNRCARPYYGEALRLFTERVASPATLDAVLRDCGGFRMGPFELMDLIGHDVNFAVTKSVWEAYFHDPRYTPSVAQQELVVAGYLGRKSGRGFYRYGGDSEAPRPDDAPPRDPPARVTAQGDLGLAAPLVARLREARVEVASAAADARDGGGALVIEGGGTQVTLALTDGRCATERALAGGTRDLVLFDYVLDFAAAKRFAIARADTCSDAALDLAIGALQATGAAVSVLDDAPALALLRTVALLVNEAADAVTQGVADPGSIDLAMKKGVNYPLGPFEWARALGLPVLCGALRALGHHYGEDRYRLSPLLARRALTGGSLDG